MLEVCVEFNKYQEIASTTAIYPNRGKDLYYPVLGLCGESGEVAEKFKKLIRDKNGVLSDVDVIEIKKELGDVLWYLSEICTSALKTTLSDVANMNLEKLKKRKNNDTLSGSGDNR